MGTSDAKHLSESPLSLETPRHRGPSNPPSRSDWLRYERLKAAYTSGVRTSEEYMAGIRRAVQEAGV